MDVRVLSGLAGLGLVAAVASGVTANATAADPGQAPQPPAPSISVVSDAFECGMQSVPTTTTTTTWSQEWDDETSSWQLVGAESVQHGTRPVADAEGADCVMADGAPEIDG